MITKQEFEDMCRTYLETVDNYSKDEYYGTEHDIAEQVLEELYRYLYKSDLEKEARRTQYEELKKEFE